MAFPEFTKSDLSEFSGRPEATYRAYTDQALKQALLLFRLATHLVDWPTDELDAELAGNAVLAMADNLVLNQPHAAVLANPFTSESIGSYSYSKRADQVRKNEETGVQWFDLAVQRLAVESDDDNVEWGSIGVFEDDMPMTSRGQTEKRWVVGPKELGAGPSTGFWRVPGGI